MNTETTVRKYLATLFDESKVGNEENLFEKGLVNSLFAMQLIQYIEREFNITLDDEDLDLENFKDISSITKLIDSKLA